MSNQHEVVITGLGLVTPLGLGVDTVWRRLTEGQSGVRRIEDPAFNGVACRIAGRVPTLQEDAEGFEPSNHISKADLRRMDRFIQFAVIAAKEAIEDAGWPNEIPDLSDDIATVIATGIGGLSTISETAVAVDASKGARLSPFTVPAFLPNLAAGQVSIRHGLKGPLGAPTTACAAGAQAIGDAARMIRSGEAVMAVAGGAEAAIHPVGVAGFLAARAMVRGFDDAPQTASRPFDKARSGFVMGEGAGIVVLERSDVAAARGASVYGILRGYGASADAHHITGPDAEGEGAERAMRRALASAGLTPSDIEYLNAHSTSTPIGDAAEAQAIRRVFGDNGVPVSSTKSAIGHLLGAAGAVEAIFALLAAREKVLPANLNFEAPDEGTEGLDIIRTPRTAPDARVVMTNAFGFGGVNSSLVLEAVSGG